MDKPIKVSLLITAIVAAGAAAYFWKQEQAALPQNAAVAASPVTVSVSETPPSERYPVPGESAEKQKNLPESLDSSDPSFQNALMALVGEDVFSKLFVSENLIRRLVIMVENATEHSLPLELIPYLSLPPPFPTVKHEDEFFTDPPKSEKRYQAYTDLILNTDPKLLVELYFHYYPLVQKAFQELRPSGHFNDRLIQVIDHLNGTPTVHGSKELLAYNESFKFEEMEIEDLSVSQKMLIRMGESQVERVKNKLKKVRELVILGP